MQSIWLMISLGSDANSKTKYCLATDTAQGHLSEHRDGKSYVRNNFAGTKFAPLSGATRHPPVTTIVGPDHVRI